MKTAKKINYISDSEEEEKFEKKLTKEEIKLKLKNKVDFFFCSNLIDIVSKNFPPKIKFLRIAKAKEVNYPNILPEK